MTTRLTQAFAELEARLATMLTANGFNTSLGASVKPAGVFLDEDDAPCVALYEAQPGREDGLMHIEAGPANACGVDFTVNYVVQAFVRRGGQSAFVVAELAAEDMMRALMGVTRGALAISGASLHKITGRARGLTPKGGDVIPVLVYGSFKINEKVYA